MAKRRNPYDFLPDEIKAMTLEQLKAEKEQRESPEGRAHWDALVKARDDAQDAVHEYHQRGYDIIMAIGKILDDEQRREDGANLAQMDDANSEP